MKKKAPKPTRTAVTGLRTAASRELDIRGMETLEAESVVETFLSTAVMGHLETVTIIHGKGTGALRNAVHDILRRNKNVKSFRLGVYGEGENGVTVVTMKYCCILEQGKQTTPPYREVWRGCLFIQPDRSRISVWISRPAAAES